METPGWPTPLQIIRAAEAAMWSVFRTDDLSISRAYLLPAQARLAWCAIARAAYSRTCCERDRLNVLRQMAVAVRRAIPPPAER